MRLPAIIEGWRRKRQARRRESLYVRVSQCQQIAKGVYYSFEACHGRLNYLSRCLVSLTGDVHRAYSSILLFPESSHRCFCSPHSCLAVTDRRYRPSSGAYETLLYSSCASSDHLAVASRLRRIH